MPYFTDPLLGLYRVFTGSPLSVCLGVGVPAALIDDNISLGSCCLYILYRCHWVPAPCMHRCNWVPAPCIYRCHWVTAPCIYTVGVVTHWVRIACMTTCLLWFTRDFHPAVRTKEKKPGSAKQFDKIRCTVGLPTSQSKTSVNTMSTCQAVQS